MGRGKHYDMKEIDDTRGVAADEAFEKIIERIKAAGGEITEDEIHPLYVDIGEEEYETGHERLVKFNLNRLDFQITRRTETHNITGSGRHKSLEERPRPRVTIHLKKKADSSSHWEVVDLEDMF